MGNNTVVDREQAESRGAFRRCCVRPLVKASLFCSRKRSRKQWIPVWYFHTGRLCSCEWITVRSNKGNYSTPIDGGFFLLHCFYKSSQSNISIFSFLSKLRTFCCAPSTFKNHILSTSNMVKDNDSLMPIGWYKKINPLKYIYIYICNLYLWILLSDLGRCDFQEYVPHRKTGGDQCEHCSGCC